ncbi:Uncharacterized protein OBRU01_18114 [Operophtera brumata]|uniref:Acyltransferase 3 domain-containing protein n=1 Tax=Operophtera brumata TaxID=104452 RepID=A0A0L7L068_OPEBR|nr:Uncharacterized protein OBRU01_18114 [Operophtera brumata]
MSYDEEYRLMPPMLRLDPYESCMRHPGAVYCTASMTFVSDEPSPLLTLMQEYSEHRSTHFNHTHVLYGTCMTTTCPTFYNTAVDLRLNLEACRNKTLYEEYKLRVQVEDDVSCVGGKHDVNQIGPAQIVMAAILIALVMLNVIGSLYDVFCKEKSGPASRLFFCFSVLQNWSRLVAVPGGQDPRKKRFKGFYGIRAILMTLVISAHSLLPSLLLNENTKFFEELYDQTWIHIFLNGTLIMQIFLQLSAFLLAYNIQIDPSLCSGTRSVCNLAANLVTIEAKDCQKDWWKHLLYINNYFDHSYLAADTQLFALGVIVIVLCKTPRSRKVVLSILFLFGLVVPGLHTYFQDLDGSLIVSPTTAVDLFVNDPTFNNVYKRGHTNISCYMLGLACGYLVYYLQETNFDVSKYKRWRPVYWALLPFNFCLILLCKLNYAEGPRMDVLYRVAIACLIKPIFGLATIIIILGIIFKMENFYRGIFEWRGLSSLGRLSYSAYLLHLAFIRTTAGIRTTTITGTYISMFEIVLFNLVATYTAAFIFYITIETPLGELAKAILEPKKPEQKTEDIVEKSDCQNVAKHSVPRVDESHEI